MTTEKDFHDIISRSLGSSNSYAVYTDKFDPSLLNPIPRKIARDSWGIKGDEFVGFDVWHCHEATFLLDNGCPVAGTLKFVYPSSSEFMIESKSIKLYLNSFDMCRMGPTLEEATKNYEDQIKKDVSSVVGTDVEVKFFDSQAYRRLIRHNPLEGYINICDIVDVYSMQFDDFYGKGSYVTTKFGTRSVKFYTNALRSRCRHTKQKDTGLAAVYCDTRSDVMVDEGSVFRQIVSLREVNEFHEFCAEKIFVEILKAVPAESDIRVMLLYSRRGSLDINPVRATSLDLIPKYLIDVNTLTEKVQGQ